MGPDQGKGQQVNLGQQGLVVFVFEDPRADIIEEFEGDVDRTSLALDLVGQMPSRVQFPRGSTTTGLATAAFVNLRKSGGQHRLEAMQPGQPGVQLSPNEGWMVGDAHDLVPQGSTAKTSVRLFT